MNFVSDSLVTKITKSARHDGKKPQTTNTFLAFTYTYTCMYTSSYESTAELKILEEREKKVKSLFICYYDKIIERIKR